MFICFVLYWCWGGWTKPDGKNKLLAKSGRFFSSFGVPLMPVSVAGTEKLLVYSFCSNAAKWRTFDWCNRSKYTAVPALRSIAQQRQFCSCDGAFFLDYKIPRIVCIFLVARFLEIFIDLRCTCRVCSLFTIILLIFYSFLVTVNF